MSKGNDKKPKGKAKAAHAGSAYKAAQSPEKQVISPFSKKPGASQLGRKRT
jgi:hypothetical protein